MFSMMIAALALASEAPQEIEAAEAPIESEYIHEVEKNHLSSKAITRLLARGLPEYCEVFYFQYPLTEVTYCGYVLCSPRGGPVTLHTCEEFGQ